MLGLEGKHEGSAGRSNKSVVKVASFTSGMLDSSENESGSISDGQ